MALELCLLLIPYQQEMKLGGHTLVGVGGGHTWVGVRFEFGSRTTFPPHSNFGGGTL